MTSSGTRHEALGTRHGVTAGLFPLALSLVAFALVLWGLLQCDVPLARFLRTVDNRSLDRVGDLLGLLGSGWTLVALSSTIALLGLAFKLPRCRTAGFQSLVAQGVAALCVQLLKRVIGRPRPRFTHGDTFYLAPSLTSGFDSFPSGHATASFAVASALARHFPRLCWLLYAVAALIGLSRIIRGSHFPTDVAVGTTLGLLVGFLVANPTGVRWTSMSHGFERLLPFLAGAFGLLWISMQQGEGGPLDVVGLGAGVASVVVGAGIRLYQRLDFGPTRLFLPAVPTANGLIGVGLALSTGSALVLAVGSLVSLAGWLTADRLDPTLPHAGEQGEPSKATAAVYATEGALIVGLGLSLVAIQSVKGVLPVL